MKFEIRLWWCLGISSFPNLSFHFFFFHCILNFLDRIELPFLLVNIQISRALLAAPVKIRQLLLIGIEVLLLPMDTSTRLWFFTATFFDILTAKTLRTGACAVNPDNSEVLRNPGQKFKWRIKQFVDEDDFFKASVSRDVPAHSLFSFRTKPA